MGKNPDIERFRQRVNELKEKGYVPLMSYTSMPHVSTIPNGDGPSRAASTDMMGGVSSIGGGVMRVNGSMFNSTQSQPKAVPGNDGTKGWMGYIPWGPNDDLPNQVYTFANLLPYTASALHYLIDLTVALGPKLMYRWSYYAGGTVKSQLVPYEDAGVLIRGRMREVAARIAAQEAAEGQEGRGGDLPWREAVAISSGEQPKKKSSILLEMDRKEMEQLEADYAEWERTKQEFDTFRKANNLEEHYQKCMTDDAHLDIYFPTYGLSIGRRAPWRPKIVRVDCIEAVCSRLEEMDEQWKSRHVFYSEKWRKDTTNKLEHLDVVAYPCLSSQDAVGELRDMVRANQSVPMAKRPLWFCTPSRNPSMLRPFYPQASWWSIFSSQVYSYAGTLIYDKAIARENSTMWGKLIYINLTYLKAMYDQMGATTDEQKETVKNQIYESVNAFLKRRSNNGKTLILDSFLSADEKTLWKSVEIVDVPQPSSGAETKSELEEISSIIFFAMGIHPALIGAVPGKSGSSGGTYQRELSLLKQQQVSPRQRRYLRFLQNICTFNEWDPHAEWVIRQQVLTTLDRNASGLEDTTSEQ